jgi:hypothetical protein
MYMKEKRLKNLFKKNSPRYPHSYVKKRRLTCFNGWEPGVLCHLKRSSCPRFLLLHSFLLHLQNC